MGQRFVGFLQKALNDLILPPRSNPHLFCKPPSYALFVPPEILSHIFSFCGTESLASVHDPACAPLVLAAVCRYWRAVALSTRELWTRVLIDGFYPGSKLLLEMWFARSGGLPMSVITHILDQPDASPDITWDLVDTICLPNHAAGVEQVLFMIPWSPAVDSPTISGSFPLLKSLALAWSRTKSQCR
ncbi:hypothetical protein FB451DRAFT_1549838 [Mycena latifolia]|nr:hypothetical protein FB451DRAFT_1549838 [Mycena latifolia]